MQAYNNFVLVSHNEILVIFIIGGTGYSSTEFLDLFKLATFESKNFEEISLEKFQRSRVKREEDLWYRSRGESTSRKWTDSGRDIFPKRLIDKLFSWAMVNQRAFGKTRGKLFILEKRSGWFIKSDS